MSGDESISVYVRKDLVSGQCPDKTTVEGGRWVFDSVCTN